MYNFDKAGTLIIMIAHAADFVSDVINLAWRNKFIDIYPTSLWTPICEFLTFCEQFEDES